jgi:hypothetical protein
VLVAGGYSSIAPPDFGITNSAELYDPVTGTWSLTGDLSTTRAWHTGTLLRNGKALVAGGGNGSSAVNTAELYDPDTGSWSGTGSLIAARYGPTATLLQDGRVMVAAGSDDGDLASTLASAELYDPASRTWNRTNSLSTNRIFHTATLLPGGKVLISGGYSWPPTSFNSSELYDPATGTWTYVGNLIGARSKHSVTLLPNGKILVAGGLDWGQGSCLPSCQPRALSIVELYDPLVAIWSNTANLNISRFDHSATLLPNGKVLVAGGFSDSNGTLSSAELYNPGADSVTNPIDDAQFFVRQHYLDFLSREPDQDGWDYWNARITECGNDPLCVHQRRIGVSGAFFVELEFQETGYVVYRLHRAAYGVISSCFGEEGEPCELRSRTNVASSQFFADRAQLVGGPGLPQSTINFANNFVQRPEFRQEYPEAMTPSDFVNKLFDTANLTGSANVPYRQAAIEALTNGSKTRAQVLLEVIEISEFKTREYNPAFVLMQYFGYLRRDPDEGGYYFWLDVLNNREPNNYRGMVCAFITSVEYQMRFGSAVTRTNQDCGR